MPVTNIDRIPLPQRVVGPTGPTGVTGNAGSTGPQVTGPTGATGPIGPFGSQGNTGPAGTAANTGATGYTGPSGPAGPAGGQGPAGPTGWTGYTGFTGVTGYTGTPGQASNTGGTGPTGPTGVTGPLGNTGPQGSAVNTGATGPTGSGAGGGWWGTLVSPNNTGWTGMNSGTGTTDAFGGLSILLSEASGGSDNARGLIQGITGGATGGVWQYDVGIVVPTPLVNFLGGGLILYDSVSGRLYTFGPHFQGGNISVQEWGSFTSVAQANASSVDIEGGIVFLRVKNDGTNYIFSYSYDNVNYAQLWHVGITTYLTDTARYIGFGGDFNNSAMDTSVWAIRCIHFKQSG